MEREPDEEERRVRGATCQVLPINVSEFVSVEGVKQGCQGEAGVSGVRQE